MRTSRQLLATICSAGFLFFLGADSALRGQPAGSGDKGSTAKAGPTVASWEEIIRLEGHKAVVRWLAISPDAARLASGMTDGKVHLWDVAKGKKIRTFGYEPFRFVSFTPDGKQLVTAGPGRPGVSALQVRLWDPTTGNMQVQLGAGGESVDSVALSPDAKLMVTSNSKGSVQAFALNRNSLKRIWSANLGFRITTLALSPDARRIAVIGGPIPRDRFLPDRHPGPNRLPMLDVTSELWILDSATGKAQFATANAVGWFRAIDGDPGSVIATVAFSPDGKLLATCDGWDGMLFLQDTQTGKNLRQLKGHFSSVLSLAFSSDGKLLASCAADYKVRIWDTATGQERAALPLASPAVVRFSPDNQFLAASGGGGVRLWREHQAKEKETK